MLIEKKLNDDDLDTFKSFRLCYIDTVPETYLDYDEKSKKLMKTAEYQKYNSEKSKFIQEKLKQDGSYSTRDLDDYDREHDPDHKFTVHLVDYETEEHANGYTHYLYFTNDMKNQWGDDWDDAPYEHNAEPPYYDETNVLKIPVYLNEEYVWLPNSYFVNSPYSVSLINEGVVPWLFIKYNKLHASVMGGDTLSLVLEKLKILNQ